MRLANERDKTIIKAAVPDAGASMVDFLSSLGNREAIAFGEGVPLPTRIRFMDLPADRIPRSQTGALVLPGAAAIDADFLGAVVERWRDATISSTKRSGLSDLDKVAELGPVDDGLGASLLPRKTG